MKYMRRKFIVLFLVTTTIGISACKKYDNDNNTDKSKNVETLKIQSAFNWKTTKDYSFNLLSYASGIVEMSDKDGKVYYKAMLTQNQPSTFKLTLPTLMKELNLSFSGKTTICQLDADVINYEFLK